jgi:hypothetical protein
MLGDADVVVIFHKSVEQLREYYDHIKKLQANGAVTSEEDDYQCHVMNVQLRASRDVVEEPNIGRVCPIAYSNAQYSMIPLGNPMTLHPNIVATMTQGRVQTPGNCAPFLFLHQSSVAAPPPVGVQGVALTHPAGDQTIGDGRTICKRCGFHRRNHPRGCFGIDKCGMTACATCGKSLRLHEVQAKKLKITAEARVPFIIMGSACVFMKQK